MDEKLKTLLSDNSIIVFSKNDCVQCKMTKMVLNKEGKVFKEINLDQRPEWIPVLRDKGFRATPVVFYEDDVWNGFRPDKLASKKAA